MKELLTMSQKKLTRLEIMPRLETKRLRQREAAKMLGVSERHMRRLLRKYREQGVSGLISERRGRPSNNQLKPEIKRQAIDLIHKRYPDFGPTLAHEKLTAVHGVKLSVGSVRQIMIAEGLWKPKKTKSAVIHQMRPRRACLGELVQIDGSPHAWFEDRGPKCNLLAYIDDATGGLMELFFTPAETTFSYFQATRHYFARHGLPVAFYSDKHSIFRGEYQKCSPRLWNVPVWPSDEKPGHRDHLRQHAPGQRPSRACVWHLAGPSGQGVPFAKYLQHRRCQCLRP